MQMLTDVGSNFENYYRMAALGVIAGLADTTKGEKLFEYQLEKKMTALRAGLPFSVDCTCYGNQLVIQADGQVSNCPFLRHDQGQINDNGVLNGGGCAWHSYELHGNTAVSDTGNAIFTKEVIHELIWTLLPREQADALRRGEITHWSYRRVGSL